MEAEGLQEWGPPFLPLPSCPLPFKILFLTHLFLIKQNFFFKQIIGLFGGQQIFLNI